MDEAESILERIEAHRAEKIGNEVQETGTMLKRLNFERHDMIDEMLLVTYLIILERDYGAEFSFARESGDDF